MTDFNLRRLVREVMATSTMSDPGDLAVEVSRRIDPDDCRAALDQALRQYVREEITRMRMRHVPVAEPYRPSPTLAPVIPPARSTMTLTEAQPAVARPVKLPAPVLPVRSAKVAGIRDWWTRELRNPIHVGGKQWVRLGDCTFDDLMFAAAERRDLAERNAARAESFGKLAEAVKAAGVGRVRDLPTDVLSAHFAGAAA